MYNAVGIDVSKGKSTVSVLQPGGVILRKPFDVRHSHEQLNELAEYVLSLDGDTRVVMECTGRYHQPVLNALSGKDIFVSAVNPHLIKNFGINTLRKVKSDPADSKKIARYALDNWADLRQYSAMDTIRAQLKTLNSQMDFFMVQRTSAMNNLISLLDLTYPGINDLFSSPVRDDGHLKWVDFVSVFWHVECVSKLNLKAFAQRYQAFCKKYGYQDRVGKADQIYAYSLDIAPSVPKDNTYKNVILIAAQQFNQLSASVEHIRNEMDKLASTLPEYETVMSMAGVGKTLGPQIIAEIGDITRFTHREALTAFAGVDPGVSSSGKMNTRSNRSSKVGSSRLRKALFLVMSALLQTKPENDPVYKFIDKKRSEGKPYLVYMTAGANKFLRIYYGRVKACIAAQSESE